MHSLIFLNSLITINALQSRIFNGNVLRPGEYGYLVKLHIDSKYKCSGSIIGARWILTSAHCFSYGANMINIYQKTSIGRNIPLTTVSSANIILHPEYAHHNQTIENRENDIALLKTTRKICLNKNIWPIKLAKSSPSIGQSAVIAGYGVGEANKLLPREGFVHISQCPYIVEHLLCTVDKVRAGDADSGGALTSEGRLVGVISASCSDAHQMDVESCTTVYANVAAHYDWINYWMSIPDKQ